MEVIIKGEQETISAQKRISVLGKALGLMFSPRKNLLFVFSQEQRISLHMLFVFFPIWALFVDEEKRVVHIQKLLPFLSLCYPKCKAKFIIEAYKKPNIKMNEKLRW